MTFKETERLAKVEQKVDDMKDDIEEIKIDIKEIKGLVTRSLAEHSRFVDKKSVRIWIGVATSIILSVIAIANFVTRS